MKLSQRDVDLFYKLMWSLQFYVNQQCRILSDIKSVEEYAALSISEKVDVRNALWKNPKLIDAYVEKNPDGLSDEGLDIVRKWKRFVAGSFQIFRFLKKHAIFIDENSHVYAVMGLTESLEEMFYGRRPPIMVQAVLLPFKGDIVYDGMLSSYNIFFGGGIRSRLKEEYMAAKQNDRIVTTLEPEMEELGRAEVQLKPKVSKDWGPAIEEIVKVSEQMKGGPAIQSAALALLRASAKIAQSAVQRPDDLDELWHLEQQARKTLTRLQTTLERVE